MNYSILTAFFALAFATTSSSAAELAQVATLKMENPTNYIKYGEAVAISGDTIVVGVTGESTDPDSVNGIPNSDAPSSGAVFVYVKVGSQWVQQAYLKASNAAQTALFGYSVAIDGDTIVVGAPEEDGNEEAWTWNYGAAYVFKRTGETWVEQAYLRSSNVQTGQKFGSSVDVDGDTVVVGAPNDAAYVFVRSGSSWTEQATLESSVVGFNQYFGSSVGVSGETIVVGAWGEDSDTSGINPASNNRSSETGAVFVFTRTGTVWSQQAFIKANPSGGTDRFGDAVAISGDTFIASAYQEDSDTSGVNSVPNNNASDAGAAYVFVREGTAWSQQAYLKASNPGAGDIFGRYLALDGDLVAIGSYHEDSSTTGINTEPNENLYQAGAVYTFERSGTTWTQREYIKPNQIGLVDEFGNAVGVSGTTIVAAAHYAFDPGGNTTSLAHYGAVYVFDEIVGIFAWRQLNFGSADDAGDGANDADYDKDGIKNLVEYGIGSSPISKGASRLTIEPKTYNGAQYLSCVFTRVPSRTDVTLRVEVSDSPNGPWTVVATSANGAVTTGPGFIVETDVEGGLKRVEARDTVPMGSVDEPDRFMRLSAQ